MNTQVKVFTRDNGEIQRVHVVSWEDWSQLDFLFLQQETTKQQVSALKCFRDIYQNFLVPGCPWIFRQMAMFALPEELEEMVLSMADSLEEVSDPLTIASIILQKGVRIRRGKPFFKTEDAKTLWQALEERECIYIICGKAPGTQMIPVGKNPGYMSEVEKDAKMKVNANFFIMDPIDCATIYDQVGTVLGLCVKDGKVSKPPQYNREALLIKNDGTVSISQLDIKDLGIEINGVTYKNGENARICTRPERIKTPAGKGLRIIVIGDRVRAVKQGGSVEIPTSGFVVCVDKANICPGDEVIYHGPEDVKFGIQVGNSIVRDGKKTTEFISQFYNIYKLDPVPFPPSLYPMDFEKARAARIALGCDKDGKPVVFWAEGAGKLGYVLGEDSTGASLSEMADIAAELGLVQAVNLDGGGSAQILVENARSLRISDRNKQDNSDAERLVPVGLIVR